MTSIFRHNGQDALREYLSLASQFKAFDVQEAFDLALSTTRYYKGDADQRLAGRAKQILEGRWYESLKAGVPDYSVYDDTYFVSDVWACWAVYSRKYLLALASTNTRYRRTASDDVTHGSLVDLFRPHTRKVADLGCGFGYTTAGLAELFPDADVYGTQIEGTFQFNVATHVGKERRFAVYPVVQPFTDLIFASEYFEHFQRPIEHLLDVIRIACPTYLVIANAFSATSLGHFSEYLHGDEVIRADRIGRQFNDTLRAKGYHKVPTSLWNNRPAIWSLA